MTRNSTRGILPLLVAASLLLAACGNDPSGATQSATTPSTGAKDGTTDVGPAWRYLAGEPEDVPLPAGAYGLTANGVSDHVVVIQAPEGFRQFAGFAFLQLEPQPFRTMGFHTAARVPPDPCGSKGHDKFDAAVDPGPSVRDLANALVAQLGAETSKPIPVTVDGHLGLYLTYQVEKGIDVAKCQEQAFDIFNTGPDGVFYLGASLERAAIWILDVDGERLVLAWVAAPGVTRAQMRELTRMVRSARFVDAG
ncbi:MAG TPA: hypothetical protein VGJ41_14960 [Nocardioides sp.]|jgi:hypothetical protein